MVAIVTQAETKFDRAEAFLKTCSREELELTAQMFEISLFYTKPLLVSAPRSKERLALTIIESEENRIAKEKNLPCFNLPEWSKNRYLEMSLTELKVEAKYKRVDLTYKTYRDRSVKKTMGKLINDILYCSNYADVF